MLEFGITFVLAMSDKWNGDFLMQRGGGSNAVGVGGEVIAMTRTPSSAGEQDGSSYNLVKREMRRHP
jgi:hypothetical protein